MKRIKLNYLMLLMMVCCSLFTTAQTQINVDGIFYIINYPNIATVTNGNGFKYSGDIIIPSSITFNGVNYTVLRISDYAFSRCPDLISVTLPNTIKEIGSNAFDECSRLTSVTLPDSITYIGERAFYSCSNLTSMIIPNSITSIFERTFCDCSELSSVILSNSITYIGESAFYNCRKLKRITLPYSLSYIGNSAFYYCEDLTDVTCLAKTPPRMGNYNSLYPAYQMAKLHVPERSVNAYKATDWWNCFLSIQGDATEDGPYDDYMKCDVNGDGEVNIADVNKVINAILRH